MILTSKQICVVTLLLQMCVSDVCLQFAWFCHFFWKQAFRPSTVWTEISDTTPCCPDQRGTNRPPSRLLLRQRSARQHTCTNTHVTAEITASTSLSSPPAWMLLLTRRWNFLEECPEALWHPIPSSPSGRAADAPWNTQSTSDSSSRKSTFLKTPEVHLTCKSSQ